VIIPVTVVLAYVFAIIERTGAVNEEPFENRLTDVPLTARCVEIEQDMRDLLNESWDPTNLHAAPTKDGYLF
jgi:putative membrane protein